MKRWFALLILISLLTLALSVVVPLPFIGGGIAGGGMDPFWVRREAENYRGFVSPAVTVTLLADSSASEQHDRDKLLHRFAATTSVNEGVPTSFAGGTITWHEQRLTVTEGNRVLVSEKLPAAFYYSALQVASIDIHGVPCLLFLTYTRASTGKVWIGLYRADGDRLFLATRSRGEVWDITPSPDGFTFVGHSESTRITLQSP